MEKPGNHHIQNKNFVEGYLFKDPGKDDHNDVLPIKNKAKTYCNTGKIVAFSFYGRFSLNVGGSFVIQDQKFMISSEGTV